MQKCIALLKFINSQNKIVIAERLRACHDKLDTKLCANLKDMCATWYFKVKCCRTCRKIANNKQ